MQSGAATKPQRKASNVGRKWSDIVKSAREPDAISRNDFLAACVMSKQSDQSELPAVWLPGYGRMRTESSAIVSPSVRPSLPPGLEPPPGLELPALEKTENNPLPEEQPVDIPAPEPEKFQALLQNLPPPMLNESMLRAMLEQAKLTDVMHLAFRANGKALITFGSYASLCQCINHFHGRQWGGASKAPVTATYVRLVKKTETPIVNDVPKQQAPVKRLSADAPVFVPGCFEAAASLHPSADKMCEVRDRVYSNASTEPGSASGMSDGCDSDTEEQVAVACA